MIKLISGISIVLLLTWLTMGWNFLLPFAFVTAGLLGIYLIILGLDDLLDGGL